MNQNSQTPKANTSLALVVFFRQKWQYFLGSWFACLAIGYGYHFLYPDFYEGSANLQMALVEGKPIEESSMLLEKMKLPLYFQQATWRQCGTGEDTTPSRTITKRLNPKLNKVAPIISFSYKSNNKDQLKQCIEAVISEIRIKQNTLSQPQIELKKILLNQNLAKLETANQNLQLLDSKEILKPINQYNKDYLAKKMDISTYVSLAREITDLKSSIEYGQSMLSPPFTEQTKIINEIYISSEPTNKNLELTTLLGLLFGLLGGVFLSFKEEIFSFIKRAMSDEE
jgi:hypothetical protein